MDRLEHTIICRQCKLPFVPPPTRVHPSEFCSGRCFKLCKDYSAARSEHCCLSCGVFFYLYPHHVVDGEGDFCSKACVHDHNTVECICLYCERTFTRKKFYVLKGWGKYCSIKCRNAFVRTAKEKATHCLHCKVFFTPIRFKIVQDRCYLFVRDNVRTCSPVCSGQVRHVNFGGKKRYRGKDNPNWKGERSSLHLGYRGPGWIERAEQVRKRQKHCCKRCGLSQEANGRKLDVNHIVPWFNFTDHRKANAYGNLEALCRACHLQVEDRTNTQFTFSFMNSKRRKVAGFIASYAKFTREQVLFIRDASASGTTGAALAQMFHCNREVIWRIVTRRSYQYI